MSEKIRRTVWLLLVMVLLLLAVSGCGNDSNQKLDSESENSIESESIPETESGQDDSETETYKGDDSEGAEDSEEVTEEDTEVSVPEYTYTDLIRTMYTTAVLNVRDLPVVEGEKIGSLAAGQEVSVTGQCKETGWYRIEYEGTKGYVSCDYLVDELPSSWVAQLDVAQGVSQMIVVTADEMGIIDVTVSMHTKDENGIWVENYVTTGQIGRNGLGKEKEGDGKTPIGVFTFTSAFGILPNPGITSMPYLQVDETHHWVDDPESKYYNKCVSTRDVEPDWNSTEHLCKYVGDYNYSLSTSYNEECIPYVGCAIFLHCTVKDFRPTSGCIAIPEEYMIQTLINLREDCIIVIDLSSEIMNY